ncbi:MAG: hypothetical protein ABFS45_03900 [Pseudomonadota bacterium]
MSTVERTQAQGMGGQPMDGEIYRQRETQAEPVIDARDKVLSECAKAQALAPNLGGAALPSSELDTDIEDLVAIVATLLPGKIKALWRAIRALEAFRVHHGITREPVVPHILLSVMILLCMILGESVINASFFQNAYMVASPFAALLLSTLISTTNVAVSVCAGYFIGRWREYGHNAVDSDAPEFAQRRERAGQQFVAYVLVMALFHISVGLVRVQESLDPVQHSLESYKALLTTPEALFLVLMGVCISVLAYHKGKTAFADPYPGYGGRAHAVLEAEEDLLDLREEIAQQLEERFDEAEEAVEKTAKTTKRAYEKYNKAVTASQEARRTLERKVRTAESGLRARIAQLAGYHSAVRGKEAPAPEAIPDHLVSFEEYLDVVEIPAFAHPPDVSASKARLAKARAEAQGRLSNEFQTLFQTIEGELS